MYYNEFTLDSSAAFSEFLVSVERVELPWQLQRILRQQRGPWKQQLTLVSLIYY